MQQKNNNKKNNEEYNPDIVNFERLPEIAIAITDLIHLINKMGNL